MLDDTSFSLAAMRVFPPLMTVADFGVGIPCGEEAEKIGAQGHESISFPNREGVADHGHHGQIVEEKIGPKPSRFSKVQLQDVVE